MCNIAGYVGTENAAGVLIDMLGREEGFDGGYYTGIATIHHGKIVWEKKTGALYTLLSRTKAASLGGKIGIIHSRSKSGGGDEWAHPFLDGRGAEPRLAYIANGGVGCCADRAAQNVELARQLMAEGYVFSSRIFTEKDKYTELPDGSAVHMSDLMCQLCMKYIEGGSSVDKAMEQAFLEAPAEIVGLTIHRDTEDRIFFARYNYPLFAGFAPDGGYLASTPLAFPETVTKVLPIPACTSGYITKDALYLTGFKDKAPFTIAEVDARVMKEGYDLICTLLSEKAYNNLDLRNAVKPLFDQADTSEPLMLLHGVYAALRKQGRLDISVRMLPGVFEGLEAPKFFMQLKSPAQGEDAAK